jgi:hypothetical protein
MTQAIHEAGGREPADGTHIYLTDTLESPNESGRIQHSYFEAPLAEEHRRAREVKQKTKILVCIGNPPYEREEGDPSVAESDRDTGSWIRNGDKQTNAPLETFLKPAREAGAGKYLRNLYNTYVYFWRWALWKVFETQDGPGIVSFITASSYLRGPSFVGMREEMRRTFDELWILDLEGDSRGTRTTENVFDIRTPVAIAVGVRYGEPNRDQAADIHYARVAGTREDKFAVLDELNEYGDLDWQFGQDGWQRPFMPLGAGDYFSWSKLTDLMPWQHAGVQPQRSWPIAEAIELLPKRWALLLASDEQRTLFRETQDRRVANSYPDQIDDSGMLPAIGTLSSDTRHPQISPIAFRSFDRQWIFRDSRVSDRNRPPFMEVTIQATGISRHCDHTGDFRWSWCRCFGSNSGQELLSWTGRHVCTSVPRCGGEGAEHHPWSARPARRHVRGTGYAGGSDRVHRRGAGASGVHRALPR